MIKLYATMALSSISRAKWRSLLTMLGVIIGVMSVVMIFALGEGLKRQVAGELKELGADTVVVRSGRLVERDEQGRVVSVNLGDVFAQSSLTEKDVEVLKNLPEAQAVAPLAFMPFTVRTDEGSVLPTDSAIIATTPAIREALNRDVSTGQFFTTPELERNLAVVGPEAAQILFGSDPPVGRRILVNNIEFIVRGVMEPVRSSPLDMVNTNYNTAIYIPLPAAKSLNNGSIAIREINIKLADTDSLSSTISTINQKLIENRQGAKDFSVLEAQDFVNILDKVFGVLTTFVATVAAISLIVGGIGIMNIMLVSVTERTREIGIRKSVGATNQQILGQFLVEAVILTMMGGVIGVALSAITTVLLRVYTDLQPFIEYRVVLVALAVTIGVGVLFGIVPALKAARKDPIESLR